MSTGASKAAVRQPWIYTKEVTETITVEDVYPGGISIPPGYEEVGFGPPKKGQLFLSMVCSGSDPSFSGPPMKSNHDYPSDDPRILLKQKDLCFKVGDCYEVYDEDKEKVTGYARVTRKTDGVWGRGITIDRTEMGAWVVYEETPISLKKEGYRPYSRREISRREFDALFIEKIVNRVPA